MADFLANILAQRAAQGRRRALAVPQGVDFSSNDYLGFARSPALHARFQAAVAAYGPAHGSSASRLLRGHSALAAEVEAEIAAYHGAEAALIFTSGYAANVGLLSCVPQAGDTVLYDEAIHASQHDGLRLGRAAVSPFSHNDLTQLEQFLRATPGRVFVVTEAVFSMDGDTAPLPELADLCERFGALLIVDEAHAAGVFGPGGAGLCVAAGVADRVFARTVTFGKALGTHGAAVLGAAVLKDYLVNYARPLVFSTAPPPHNLLAVQAAYHLLKEAENLRSDVQARIAEAAATLADLPGVHVRGGQTPVVALVVGDDGRAVDIARRVQAAGFDVRAIRPPSVPLGTARLRVCVHAFNTSAEIQQLAAALNQAVRAV